jgi:predicted amidohydrolase
MLLLTAFVDLMQIGFVQFAPSLGDLSSTIAAIERLSEQFPPHSLLVLPELCNSGYNFVSSAQAWETSESVDESAFVRFLSNLCRQRNLHIVSGLNEREGERLFNSAVLVGPQGLIGKYRKLHLFLNEKDFFIPGDLGLPVFDVPGARIGMLVCFDWTFPEVWRSLALDGADIICHPSNLVLPGRAQKAVPVQAMMNRVFVVTANRIGVERELTFTGSSLICNPSGDILAAAPAVDESVMLVDVDVRQARDKRVTAKNDLFGDRRPDQYRRLFR